MQMNHKPELRASWIAPDALEIVRLLQAEGFETYLVGGCVRDLLAGQFPKDFDIATTALPNQVRRKIRGAYVIGRRFRLVLVKRGAHQYEVATFRRAGRADDISEEEAPPTGDNFFGTAEEDALRRDFTINALFYDPANEKLVDYAQGLRDIEERMIRMIGDPVERIKEDPIRSLRALRLAHKLGFKIEESLRRAIALCGQDLLTSVLPRRREEFLKMLKLPSPAALFLEMADLDLISILLPSLRPLFSEDNKKSDFLLLLDHLTKDLAPDASTSEIFALFIHAVFSSFPELLQNHQDLEKFLKGELGIYRTELAEIFASFESLERLKNSKSFQKKGPKRQQSFLANPSLPLALDIARKDYLLSSHELAFWQHHLALIQH
jgi:poly(A) polymerase